MSLYITIDIYEEESRKMNKYLTETSCEDNLYPGFKDFDLKFLIGQCIIYLSKSYNEPLIKFYAKTGSNFYINPKGKYSLTSPKYCNNKQIFK